MKNVKDMTLNFSPAKIVITPTSEEHFNTVKETIDSLSTMNDVSEMVATLGHLSDSGKAVIERELSESEKEEVLDLMISAQFDEMEKKESLYKSQWILNFMTL